MVIIFCGRIKFGYRLQDSHEKVDVKGEKLDLSPVEKKDKRSNFLSFAIANGKEVP